MFKSTAKAPCTVTPFIIHASLRINGLDDAFLASNLVCESSVLSRVLVKYNFLRSASVNVLLGPKFTYNCSQGYYSSYIYWNPDLGFSQGQLWDIFRDKMACSPVRVNRRFGGAIASIFRVDVQEVGLISNRVLTWEFSRVMLECQNMKLKLYL
jgi:hypothetical protein